MADVKTNFLDFRIYDGSIKIKGFLINSIVKKVKKKLAMIFVIKISNVKSPKEVLS